MSNTLIDDNGNEWYEFDCIEALLEQARTGYVSWDDRITFEAYGTRWFLSFADNEDYRDSDDEYYSWGVAVPEHGSEFFKIHTIHCDYVFEVVDEVHTSMLLQYETLLEEQCV